MQDLHSDISIEDDVIDLNNKVGGHFVFPKKAIFEHVLIYIAWNAILNNDLENVLPKLR